MEILTVPVGQLQANCYIIIDESTADALVIDPGDEAVLLSKHIDGAGAYLRHILLTHGHPDHSFAAGELQQIYPQADLLMHEADLPQLEGEPELTAMLYDLSAYVNPRFGSFLKGGEEIRIGETELLVVHTAGHSPGGLCFVGHGRAFTGDTLFAGGIGRTDFLGGSHDALMLSIREKLLPLPGDTIIYPGHGPSSTIEKESRTNPYL